MDDRVEDGWSREEEPSSRWRVARLLLVAVGLAAAAALLLVVRSLPRELLPANTDYTLTIASGVQPITAPVRVAALARGYLDEQTELAAPEIHSPPRILSLVAVPAREARAVEPRIPAGPVASAPGRVIWVVGVSGDLLNLHDLPWSATGAPYPTGTLVFDDATEELLGVYPHDPPDS